VYREFYGLTCLPFSKTPDPRFLYLSRFHNEAMARLEYAVTEKELVVLTGEVGCGKTTLSRALMDILGSERYDVVTILNPRLTPDQFLRTISQGLGIGESGVERDDLLLRIYERVYRGYETGRTPVIIVDEAQLVPGRETFEEIRLLTNFQLDAENLLSVVLIGQPDLKDRLRERENLPLQQRIGMQYHLAPLEEDEITPYIEHRLAVAGRSYPLFTEEAVWTLYQYSGGIPRVLNHLAANSLLEGFSREAELIGGDIVLNVARDFELSPRVPGISTSVLRSGPWRR